MALSAEEQRNVEAFEGASSSGTLALHMWPVANGKVRRGEDQAVTFWEETGFTR